MPRQDAERSLTRSGCPAAALAAQGTPVSFSLGATRGKLWTARPTTGGFLKVIMCMAATVTQSVITPQ